MLKLNYTESGLHLEQLSISLEILIQERVILALRAGQVLHVEPGKAAFLLPVDAPELAHLEMMLRIEQHQSITVSPVDNKFIEVSVEGTWIAESTEAHAGTFVTAFSDRTEFLVYKLWQANQPQMSFLV